MSVARLGLNDEPPEDGWGPDRTPPHDLLAEQSCLGGMMLSAAAVEDVAGVVQGRDFYIPKHEVIFGAMLALVSRSEPVDVITVANELEQAGQLQRAGGAEYLHTIVGQTVTAANAGYHAEIVAKKAVLRRLVEAGTRITQMGYASEGEVHDLLTAAAREVDDAASMAQGTGEVRLMSETVLGTIGQLEQEDTRMVPTPWRALNKAVGGLRPGRLYIVGARPGVGKTAIGLQLASGLAGALDRDGKRLGTVAFCSLEMSEQELTVRLMSQQGNVLASELATPSSMSAESWARIAAWRVSAPLSIAVDERPGVSVFDVRTFARQVARKHRLVGVVVDYLQLMTDPRDIPRHEKVGDMSRGLKNLARELDVPVIALSQLNRASEQRADKMPNLADLRESGAIEQDADVVVLLHRDMSGKVDASDQLVMYVAKNRHGEVGPARVRWQGEYVRALDYGASVPNPVQPTLMGGAA